MNQTKEKLDWIALVALIRTHFFFWMLCSADRTESVGSSGRGLCICDITKARVCKRLLLRQKKKRSGSILVITGWLRTNCRRICSNTSSKWILQNRSPINHHHLEEYYWSTLEYFEIYRRKVLLCSFISSTNQNASVTFQLKSVHSFSVS